MTAVGSRPSYTVVTCHFGDLFWVRHTLEQVDRLSDDRVQSVVVVDQNRSDAAELRRLPRVTDVLEFEPDEALIAALGHDHPAALNRALRTVRFETSHVIVLDSDCFPLDASWLDRVDDVTLAGNVDRSGRYAAGQTHPCFMVLPTRLLPSVDFADGIIALGFDTGRLVGLQVLHAGEVPTILEPERRRAFGDTRGHYFLDRTVYHHGSASFVSSSYRGLSQHVMPALEAQYRKQVASGSLAATPGIAALYRVQRMRRRARLARQGLRQIGWYRSVRRWLRPIIGR